ncbi:MAG: hypothetical protein WBW87_05590 [Candidatus Cybelea sp.]
MRHLIAEAKGADLPLTLRTAKINPATKLYERLGFTAMGSDKYKVYLTWWPKGDLRFTSATEQDTREQSTEGHSLAAQESRLRSLAASQGVELGRVFVDAGFSGATSNVPPFVSF